MDKRQMKLYLISQDVCVGYDTFDSAVVCAKNKEEARKIHPYGDLWGSKFWNKQDSYGCWAYHPDQVDVHKIGNAMPDMKKGVVCASFNAG